MAEHGPEHHHTSEAAGHELTDAAPKPLVNVGIAMAVLVIGTFIGIVVLFKVLSYYQPLLDPEPHPLSQTRAVSSEPRIQVDPPKQRSSLREIEDHLLTTYDWVDRDQGLVRIPISRAIEILGERGLPEITGSVEGDEGTGH